MLELKGPWKWAKPEREKKSKTDVLLRNEMGLIDSLKRLSRSIANREWDNGQSSYSSLKYQLGFTKSLKVSST